ncbi:MAG: enoyl-CoA hydratase/isomerase family protein [Bacteroidota bacterium]
MFGEPFGAAKARDAGLVTEVVAEAELLAVATAAAEKLADQPPGALKIAKQLLRRALMPQIEAALEEGPNNFERCSVRPRRKRRSRRSSKSGSRISRRSTEKVNRSEVL